MFRVIAYLRASEISVKMYQNSIVWITGASSGIGAETAIQMNAAGAFVILSARNKEALQKVQNQLKFKAQSAIICLDLEKSEGFAEIAREIQVTYGRIDYLINNGGLSQRGEAADTSMEVNRRIMEINYFGNIALTKAVLPVMHSQKSGHIVVIASIAGKFGFFLRSAYSASKHALQGYYESLLLEEEKNNIFVTLVYPGKINTEISKSALNASGNAHGVMDHNQETGMPVSVCVRKMLKAVSKKKKAVLIGKKEILAVHIKRFWPWLFWKIIRKQKAV
ncbi:MAG: SDR family oxidoreductase [Bacteroidetes bacterium]|nr:SDR family oxidoreductase [Bacteroidota bacterium]